MKHQSVLLICLLASSNLLANINHIDISKISKDKIHIELFGYVKDNHQYFSHWTPNWTYNKSKPELDLKLQEAFRAFSSLTSKNTETYLLLGDIAHYLYNLDVQVFFDSAVINYNNAMTMSPKDFRVFWFLGFHYAQSNSLQKGLDNLFQAEHMLPSSPPADFWNDYAWATGVANMPTHSIFAMDKVRELAGKPGTMEEQMGAIMRKRIVDVDRDSTYKREKIWYATQGEKTTFTSRPLGIKLTIDSTWQINVIDYGKRMGFFILNPPTAKNKAGREIHYTIALLMKVADEGEKLDEYLQKFMGKTGEKKKIKFSDKYEKMIAYEIKDKTMYPDIGGGHMYMVGVERDAPKYPGFILEDPFSFPKGKKELTYYTPHDSKNRFKGKIFYGIMLDSCEDIHEESLTVFKQIFENQIVIE
jgi:hypothetical protein